VTELFGANLPLLIVVLVSVVTGLIMVVVFRYTSDQKVIRSAKDKLKAHLLAVRLFQDQLPVVLRSYGRILRGTATYLRLAFKPLLFVAIPITVLIVQLDYYLGLVPFHAGEAILITAQMANANSLDEVSLRLPPEIAPSAPPVHVPANNQVVWRVVAEKDGRYDIGIGVSGQTFSKNIVVSSGVERLSPVRLHGRFWERLFVSAESALPESSPIESIAVNYSERSIHFAWLDWNWIWLFFVLSLVAGFLFKEILGIEI
jgi:uncharacterized membrane protein (DUF106 family)